MNDFWQDWQTNLLKKLWNEGRTASQIAEDVAKSRNAVIGKARRMKLAPRPSPIRRAA